jgi:hypothetical protein
MGTGSLPSWTKVKVRSAVGNRVRRLRRRTGAFSRGHSIPVPSAGERRVVPPDGPEAISTRPAQRGSTLQTLVASDRKFLTPDPGSCRCPDSDPARSPRTCGTGEDETVAFCSRWAGRCRPTGCKRHCPHQHRTAALVDTVPPARVGRLTPGLRPRNRDSPRFAAIHRSASGENPLA